MRSSKRGKNPTEIMLPFGVPQIGADGEATPLDSDQHRPRRRSRGALRQLAWSSPILVLAFMIALFLIVLPAWSAHSLGRWNDGAFAAADEGYVNQRWWTQNGPETWVAHFNHGTAQLRQGNTGEAVDSLRVAYDGVPRAKEVEEGRIQTYSYECQVRINLSLGIEMQGDEAAAGEDWAAAAEYYDEALGLVTPCQSTGGAGGAGQSGGGQSGGDPQSGDGSDSQSGGGSDSGDQGADGTSDPGEQADQSSNRLEDKSNDAQNNANGGSNEDPGSRGSSTDPSTSDPGSSDPGSTGGGGSTGSDSSGGADGQGGTQTPSPWDGETESERQRREQLESKNRQDTQRKNDAYDEKRSGAPNGAW